MAAASISAVSRQAQMGRLGEMDPGPGGAKTRLRQAYVAANLKA